MTPIASRRRDTVADDLRERGYSLTADEWPTVARGDTTTIAGVDAPLALVSLRDDRPLTVVSAIANAAHEGYVPVLVAHPQTASEIEPLLEGPFLLAGRDSGREFVPIEDRILLSDDSYACLGTTGPVNWFEEDSRETDSPPLALTVGGDRVATLDSVDGLACPGPAAAAFRYSYARNDAGRFCVFDDGDVLERYASVSAMRADGFRPVPLPLVPEHHIRDHGRLARATVVATVDDGVVSYRSRR